MRTSECIFLNNTKVNMLNDEVTLPENYRFIVDDDGQIVSEGGNYLLFNTEDGSQAWLSSLTSNEEMEESQQPSPYQQSDTTHQSGTSHCNNDKDGSTTTYQWNNDETRLFLTLVEKYLSKLENSKYKKKDIFEDISKEMYLKSGGCSKPTVAQCENRYKSLYKKFKDIADHNNKSGNSHKKWEFFEEMDKLFGRKANIVPKARCSSINEVNCEEHKTTALALKEKLRLKRKADDEEKNDAPKKKTSKVRSELLELAKKQQERQEKYEDLEERKLKILQEQHNDVMSVLNKIADKLT